MPQVESGAPRIRPAGRPGRVGIRFGHEHLRALAQPLVDLPLQVRAHRQVQADRGREHRQPDRDPGRRRDPRAQAHGSRST